MLRVLLFLFCLVSVHAEELEVISTENVTGDVVEEVASKEVVSEFSLNLPEPTKELKDKWDVFNKKAGREIRPFAEKYLDESTQNVRSVFYPFGGPDATFPMLLFPKAENITIVGLEFPGKPEAIEAGLKSDKMQQKSLKQVESLFIRSFFITSQMGKQFSREMGITAPLLMQLRMLGVEKVTISKPDLPFSGIKISFEHNGIQKTIRYFRIDLSDSKNPDVFLKAIKEKGLIQGCMIKSSSYIPHQKNFVAIRDFVRENADVIIQDDTGVPYKFLKDNFKVRLLGVYKGPYGSTFKGYKQKEMPEHEAQVPFCFGYGCRAQNSVLMLALKEKASSNAA